MAIQSVLPLTNRFQDVLRTQVAYTLQRLAEVEFYLAATTLLSLNSLVRMLSLEWPFMLLTVIRDSAIFRTFGIKWLNGFNCGSVPAINIPARYPVAFSHLPFWNQRIAFYPQALFPYRY
jgi:hypothetical protein